MADKKQDKPAEAPAEGAGAPAKKKLPIKMFGVIGGVLIIEAVAIIGIFVAIKPKSSQAHTDAAHVQHDDSDTLKEIKVIDDRFQSMVQGKSWLWQVTVQVQAKKRYADKVQEMLKSREAEVKEGVRQIIARADPNALREPELKMLKTQLTSFLSKVVGVDEKSNEPLIDRVLVPRCLGFPGDY